VGLGKDSRLKVPNTFLCLQEFETQHQKDDCREVGGSMEACVIVNSKQRPGEIQKCWTLDLFKKWIKEGSECGDPCL
jgi:hypothetical protein